MPMWGSRQGAVDPVEHVGPRPGSHYRHAAKVGALGHLGADSGADPGAATLLAMVRFAGLIVGDDPVLIGLVEDHGADRTTETGGQFGEEVASFEDDWCAELDVIGDH